MLQRLFKDYRHLAREYYRGSTFVAFDTETTGLKASNDYIIEIGAVKFNKNGIIGSYFDTLIKPPVEINPFITSLTHISNEMVQDKPDEKVVLPDFINYIENKNTYLIAHNAPFDLGFINTALERNMMPSLNQITIDTLPLSRWAFPELANKPEKGVYKLQSLAQTLDISVLSAHRACDDARVCMELFIKCIEHTLDQQKDYKEFLNSKADDGQLSLF